MVLPPCRRCAITLENVIGRDIATPFSKPNIFHGHSPQFRPLLLKFTQNLKASGMMMIVKWTTLCVFYWTLANHIFRWSTSSTLSTSLIASCCENMHYSFLPNPTITKPKTPSSWTCLTISWMSEDQPLSCPHVCSALHIVPLAITIASSVASSVLHCLVFYW